MISDEVVNIFENAAKFNNNEFQEDDVDGGIQSVCVSCEEDYMIAMAYIADCFTFNRNIDLENRRAETVDSSSSNRGWSS